MILMMPARMIMRQSRRYHPRLHFCARSILITPCVATARRASTMTPIARASGILYAELAMPGRALSGTLMDEALAADA